jgi:hypothetical protein
METPFEFILMLPGLFLMGSLLIIIKKTCIKQRSTLWDMQL